MNKNNYQINGIPLLKIQNILVEILEEIDRICKKHNIKYFLSGGTLLGAIRHNGFIPWDDDLDLWMVRKEYKKFKKAVKKDLDKDRFVFEDYYSNLSYPLSILKIKRKNTVFIEQAFKDLDIFHALYVDVFPLDKVFKFLFKPQTFFLIKYQSVRLYKLDKNKDKYSKAKRFFYGIFTLRFVRFLSESTMRIFNFLPLKNYAQLCHRPRYWPIFSKDEVDEIMLWNFCEHKYPIPVYYDRVLKKCYGNYLELPPLEKREPSHEVVKCDINF